MIELKCRKPLTTLVLLVFAFAASVSAYAKGNCSSDEYFVRAHPRRAYIKTDGTHVRATFVSASCHKRSKIFNEWSPKLSSKLPEGWPKGERPKTWLEDEKELLFDALEALPDLLTSQSIRSVLRLATSSAAAANPASRAPEYIALYDAAFSGRQNLSRILAHELTHEFYDNLPTSKKLSYFKATQWSIERKNGKDYVTRRSSGYVEEDGINSPDEDFANNVEYYLFDPDKLKKVTPSAFDWIQTNYGKDLKLEGRHK